MKVYEYRCSLCARVVEVDHILHDDLAGSWEDLNNGCFENWDENDPAYYACIGTLRRVWDATPMRRQIRGGR